jgi:hypothetical protein
MWPRNNVERRHHLPSWQVGTQSFVFGASRDSERSAEKAKVFVRWHGMTASGNAMLDSRRQRCWSAPKPQPEFMDTEKIRLADLLEKVGTELIEAHKRALQRGVPLLGFDECEVECAISTEFGPNGEVNLWAVKIGAERKQGNAQTVRVKYKPYDPKVHLIQAEQRVQQRGRATGQIVPSRRTGAKSQAKPGSKKTRRKG